MLVLPEQQRLIGQEIIHETNVGDLDTKVKWITR